VENSSMTELPFNPYDPAYLFSRSLDEPISPEEQEILARAVSRNPGLAKELDSLRQVSDVVRRWSLRSDSQGITDLNDRVISVIKGGDAFQEAKLDHVLARWKTTEPVFDDQAFTRTVMQAVGRSHRLAGTRRWVLRIGMPLAAAASIMLALVGVRWFESHEPVSVVWIGPRGRVEDEPTGEVQITRLVQFDRTTVAEATVHTSVTVISVGSSAWEPQEDVPPL
jgi:hypothetical protein